MMDTFLAEVKLLAYRYPYSQQQEYVPYRMVVDDVTHYPPLTTLELYDSDPLIDLGGFFSVVDFCVHCLCASTAILSTETATTSL